MKVQLNNSLIRRKVLVEGETIETKVKRMLDNKEPIKDGAPLIFTERKDGVVAGYNIRTDRWEVAADAMDKVTASKRAKSDDMIKEPKIVDMKGNTVGESTQGEQTKTS